jgi:hypothetical protein
MKHGTKINHWTEEEIEILKSNFSTCTNKELTRMLPLRSIDSVKQRALLLNLSKTSSRVQKVDIGYKKIWSGILSVNGNVTTHRMM